MNELFKRYTEQCMYPIFFRGDFDFTKLRKELIDAGFIIEKSLLSDGLLSGCYGFFYINIYGLESGRIEFLKMTIGKHFPQSTSVFTPDNWFGASYEDLFSFVRMLVEIDK